MVKLMHRSLQQTFRSSKFFNPLLLLQRLNHEYRERLLIKKFTGPEVNSYTTKYGGLHTVTMLPGGGVGPELTGYVRAIFKECGAPVEFEVIEIDPSLKGDDDLKYALTSIKRNGVAIKGHLAGEFKLTEDFSRNVKLRNELDTFVNVIHVKSYPGIRARQKDLDLILVRQNVDGEYALLEHEPVKGVVESLKIVNRVNVRRVAHYAFELAHLNGRRKVSTVHMAHMLSKSDGLFIDVAKEVAKKYPRIQHEIISLESICKELLTCPHEYDVLNMTNLYGSIVGNMLCGLCGGAGLCSGMNYGDNCAVFEPATRDICKHLAGKNIVNPVAMINASVEMLQYLGHHEHAKKIFNAMFKTVFEDGIQTRDLGGCNTSTEVVDNILCLLEDKRQASAPENDCE